MRATHGSPSVAQEAYAFLRFFIAFDLEDSDELVQLGLGNRPQLTRGGFNHTQFVPAKRVWLADPRAYGKR